MADPTRSEPLVDIQGLSMSYSLGATRIAVLRDVDLQIHAG